MTLADRLNEVISSRHISKREFARRIGVPDRRSMAGLRIGIAPHIMHKKQNPG